MKKCRLFLNLHQKNFCFFFPLPGISGFHICQAHMETQGIELESVNTHPVYQTESAVNVIVRRKLFYADYRIFPTFLLIDRVCEDHP